MENSTLIQSSQFFTLNDQGQPIDGILSLPLLKTYKICGYIHITQIYT